MRAVFFSVLFLGAQIIGGPAGIGAGGWTQWRGPNRDGTIGKDQGVWPDSLGKDHLQELWRVDLAEGYSSPVTGGGRVFTVETRAKKSEIARAFDLKTGVEAWSREWDGAMKVPFFAAKNGSWVRSTPTTDGESVYVAGMRDVLANLDAETGKERWRVDFTKREGTQLPSFGYVSSPLIDGDVLYVQAGMAVAKLDRKTGKTVWRAMEDRRAMFGSAFSSPVIAMIGGKRQLVVQTRMTLSGLDMDSGAVLWSMDVKAFRGMNILTPTVVGDEIFTATYGGGAFLFRAACEDGKWSVKRVWNKEKIEGYMASPLAIGQHLYHLARDKRLYCLEWASGAVVWKSEEKFGDYMSMVANGSRVLSLKNDGELMLFDASPKGFKVSDRRRVLKQSTWAHLGVEGEYLMVRGLKGLAVFAWK